MKTSCPHCGQQYEIDDGSIGKEADCTNCGKRFVLQALSESSEPAQAQPAVRCPYCDGEISPGVKKCRHCGEWIELSAKPKNPVVYVVLALFVGLFGIHNFYADEDIGALKILFFFIVSFAIFVVFEVSGIQGALILLASYFLIISLVNMGDMANCDSRLQNAARKRQEKRSQIQGNNNAK